METVSFKCPKCHKIFTHTFNLADEPDEPHEAKPLSCPYCGNIEYLEEVSLN